MSDETKQFIDALGGYRAVAERLKENPTTVHNWTVGDTFPVSRFFALRDLAGEAGIEPPCARLFRFKALPEQATGDAA